MLARGRGIAMLLTELGNMDGVAFWGEIKSSEMLRGKLGVYNLDDKKKLQAGHIIVFSVNIIHLKPQTKISSPSPFTYL